MTRTYIAAAALLGALAAVGAAQTTARVPVSADSKLWIEGTSNLHGWSCKAEKFDATIELDAAAIAELATATPKVLKRVEVKVPVKSLKCGHGGMDDNLYKALKADDTPEISYILATFDAAPGEARRIHAEDRRHADHRGQGEQARRWTSSRRGCRTAP